jgi:hypothetical protein
MRHPIRPWPASPRAGGLVQTAPPSPGPWKSDRVAERLLFWTIALHPLWWILGLQVFVYPLMGWYLLYRSLQHQRLKPLTAGWSLWLLYTGVWLVSMLVNLALGTAQVGRSMTALGSVFGIWMLMAIVWYAVRQLEIRYRVIVRALCIVGTCQFLFLVLGETYHLLTGTVLETQSLILTLVPSMPAGIFFHAQFYGFETLEWGAEPVVRLKSFYYWSPLAGTMSLFTGMAAFAERDRRWQVLAWMGSLVTIWLAAARAAQVGIVLAIIVALWFGSRGGRRILMGLLIPIGVLSPVILEILYNYFFKYRSDSTEGRMALYEETYQAFLNSPFLGYGAQGHSEVLDVPLGSHSQLYSTLYQTGTLGSVVLAAAWIAISLALLKVVLQRPSLSPTLGAWVSLSLVMMTGELAAGSVTVFSLAALLGGAWNEVEWARLKVQQPWLAIADQAEPPTPWEQLQQWWQGTV